MQRDLQMAGFGLPVFNKQNPPLKCDPTVTVDHDGSGATPVIDMFPIQITDGGGASDTIQVRYSVDGAAFRGGVAMKIIGTTSAPEIEVANNLGCNNNDVVLLSAGSACAMTRVSDNNLATDNTHITLANATGAANGASLTCLGRWNQFTYTVANNQLQRNDASVVNASPLVSEIVNIQAQYGISDSAGSNQVTSWVSAIAPWNTPSIANRNRIKAVRVAVVARNGLLEKTNVTAAAPVAWADVDGSPAPTIDLTGDADWQRYRYRVYETIIPLRNMIWSSNTLL
jgi:type IV pilus assembly protein PilW